MRKYTDLEYDQGAYDGVLRTGSKPYLGTFGSVPEISFNVDEKTAMKMAKKYNQHSLFDVKTKDIKKNPDYIKYKNPTGGKNDRESPEVFE